MTAYDYRAPEQVVGLIPCGYGHGNPCRQCAELYQSGFQNNDVPQDSDVKQGEKQQHGDLLSVLGFYASLAAFLLFLLWLVTL
jgi:hypothetical protein